MSAVSIVLHPEPPTHTDSGDGDGHGGGGGGPVSNTGSMASRASVGCLLTPIKVILFKHRNWVSVFELGVNELSRLPRLCQPRFTLDGGVFTLVASPPKMLTLTSHFCCPSSTRDLLMGIIKWCRSLLTSNLMTSHCDGRHQCTGPWSHTASLWSVLVRDHWLPLRLVSETLSDSYKAWRLRFRQSSIRNESTTYFAGQKHVTRPV